jgi:hypothetical protein
MAIDAIQAMTMTTETGRVSDRGSGVKNVMDLWSLHYLIGPFAPGHVSERGISSHLTDLACGMLN